MFLLSVILCADTFTDERVMDEDEVTKVIPLAAESRRLRELIIQLVAALDKGCDCLWLR